MRKILIMVAFIVSGALSFAAENQNKSSLCFIDGMNCGTFPYEQYQSVSLRDDVDVQDIQFCVGQKNCQFLKAVKLDEYKFLFVDRSSQEFYKIINDLQIFAHIPKAQMQTLDAPFWLQGAAFGGTIWIPAWLLLVIKDNIYGLVVDVGPQMGAATGFLVGLVTCSAMFAAMNHYCQIDGYEAYELIKEHMGFEG